MPQPLSSIVKDKPYEVTINPDGLLQKPNLANLVAVAIGWSSNIEYALGLVLVTMLDANVKPAFAMFSAITSAAAQRSALSSAAEAVLSPDDLEIFGAVLAVARTTSEQRNKFAHGLWGTSPQVPDALLLVSPEHILGVHAQQTHFFSLPPDLMMDLDQWPSGEIDPTKIFVYREKDFQNLIRDFEQTATIVARFRDLVDPRLKRYEKCFPEPPRDEILRQLSNQRPFAEALSRIRERQKKRQKAPPQSLQQDDP
jgi:hypothetical protein